MTDDWTKDFEKLLKNIRFVDKTSFEEVPGDVQLKAFIAEQRERAREETVEDIKTACVEANQFPSVEVARIIMRAKEG